ncbi:MAG: CbtA family protein [Nitrososphaerales archaeon]
MKLLTFIGITLLAGVISGLVYGGINLLAAEPFIDQAIGIEIQNLINEGEEVDMDEITQYRLWQKGGLVVAGLILGVSFASLYAIVYGYARKSLPGSSEVRKSLLLASIIWFTIFMIPFLKYPGNPPAVGDPETIYYRESLYIAFIAISGLGALGFAFLYRKMSSMKARKFIVPALYAAYIIPFYFIMPPNPDAIMVPMELVTNFRIVTAITATIFWVILGITFGALWDKFKLHVGLRKVTE